MLYSEHMIQQSREMGEPSPQLGSNVKTVLRRDVLERLICQMIFTTAEYLFVMHV